MNDRIIVDYWMEKARDDIASARDNHASGRYQQINGDRLIIAESLNRWL